MSFLLGANDQELSQLVPKVVLKSKLRIAIEKLKVSLCIYLIQGVRKV